MEALNLAFYGTMITKGHGKAIVLRTGAFLPHVAGAKLLYLHCIIFWQL